MSKSKKYFCQGCSAVLSHRVCYCPHCGRKQYYNDECGYCGAPISENDEECPECFSTIQTDENNPRSCPNCGKDLDMESRNLELRYCFGDDCYREIGGLIRYSEETGDPLTVEEILSKNDYEKEVTDWLANIYNQFYTGYYPAFDRMLYIYDKTGKYTVDDFKSHFGKVLDEIYIHTVSDFYQLSSDDNLYILEEKDKHPPKNYKHCLCVVGIEPAVEETIDHETFKGKWGHYNPTFESYERDGHIYKPDVSYIFVSSVIPDLAQIGSIHDRYFLLISPEILNSIDISKIWKNLMKKNKYD